MLEHQNNKTCYIENFNNNTCCVLNIFKNTFKKAACETLQTYFIKLKLFG